MAVKSISRGASLELLVLSLSSFCFIRLKIGADLVVGSSRRRLSGTEGPTETGTGAAVDGIGSRIEASVEVGAGYEVGAAGVEAVEELRGGRMPRDSQMQSSLTQTPQPSSSSSSFCVC